MLQRPTLETKLADLANRFRFAGISLAVIAGVAFLFSPRGQGWPLDALSVALYLLFAIGCTSLVCGQLVIRKLVGFGSMETPPVTLPQSKG
ncbi:hypothetical protein IP81_04325 [Novosphingobium sp. AAP83]|uniref:hypothetical protein n=1 Tax=Novosphingobium sp. AAP83 TaxID=1523425 RepID=UPI0006B91ECE|nr:hypothetical protein [Novosphingobium sp. AAP83]KPF93431.1 hypothetical protein IP81_04325 [Novosphingobium sp. AAP83]